MKLESSLFYCKSVIWFGLTACCTCVLNFFVNLVRAGEGRGGEGRGGEGRGGGYRPQRQMPEVKRF